MKTLRISVDQISEYSYLEFGERGENAVTEVILDFSAWVEEYGEGIVNLYVKRGGDTSAYPVPLSVDGTAATWLVSDTDTYKRGRGEAEYVYVVGEKVEKTAVFGYYVNRDIGQPSVTPPSPYETWLDTLMELSNTTLQNAQDAEESAEKAETASQHYPVIVDNYWWVWRVEEEAYVNTDVKAEGEDFTIKGTVPIVADLPETATQGTYYNVGESAPYSIYMWQDGVGWMYQGQLQGPTGATFVPSVSDEGIISWTNDGGLPNPEPKNIRGPQGVQGVKGDAAGFGTPVASVDQTIGQASVSVSASGPDTAKVFNFAFSGIKGERGERGVQGETGGQGEKGDPGDSAGFGTPTASVNSDVGTPSVSVTASGPDTAKVFNFQFRNLKGDRGEQGETGSAGPQGVKGDTGDKGDRGVTFTPSVNEAGVISWTNDGGLPNPSSVSIKGPQGEQGIQGVQGNAGNDGATFTPSVSNEGVISWTNDGGKQNPPSVNIKGPQGAQGDPGAAAGFGTPTASVDQTVGTPSVSVTATGPNTAKVFNFQFSGLKGETGQQGIQGNAGADGTTFTPSVSSEGVISWTNDGGKTNPQSVNIKGPQGIQGVQGETGADGAAAGFGTPSATVGTGTGTPSVSVSASGPDTAKVFSFAFDGLKGAPGSDGQGVPTGGTAGQFLKKSSGTDFDSEWADVEIPTKVSDLTNDAGYITGMEILSYGNSTFADFLAAYTAKKVVYCRASSNANPASGSQTRLAFMAYVNNADTPTEVEFQYYRSVSSHTASQQGDQVFVYKLTKTAGWTVTTREAMSKIAAGTGLSSSYSNGTLTLSSTVNGIPAGGTTGQVLKKSSATDYATEWGDESGGSLKVTFTGSGSLSADKTFTEVSNALSEGRSVYGVYGSANEYFSVDLSSSSQIEFRNSRVMGAGSSFSPESLFFLTEIIIMKSDGSITYSHIPVQPPYALQLVLYKDDSAAYQDPPTGTLTVRADALMYDLVLCLTNPGKWKNGSNSNNASDMRIVNGIPDGYVQYTDDSDTYYPVSLNTDASGDEPVYTINFQCMGTRNGDTILKKLAVAGLSDDYVFEATVTYSEVTIGQAPSASGVSF